MKLRIREDEFFPYYFVYKKGDYGFDKATEDELFDIPDDLANDFLSAEGKFREVYEKIGAYYNDEFDRRRDITHK